MINYFTQLSQRDRLALIVMTVVIALSLGYVAIIEPYHAATVALDGKIAARGRQALRVQELTDQYTNLHQRLDRVEQTLGEKRNFSLFSFVEKLVDRVAGRENLVYMRPQPAVDLNGIREETVAIKLEKLRLDQFTTLLHRLETAAAALQVKNLRLKTRFDDASLLDGVLTIAAYGKTP